jgi:hypothetical protein
MKFTRIVLTALAVALSVLLNACEDGGVGGTGITGNASATLQGNIQDISASGSLISEDSGKAAAFGGIWVGVQGTGVSDITADDGSFVLVGQIAGDRVVEFRQPDSEQVNTLNVTVLGEAVTTLKDLRIIQGRVVADAIQVNNVRLILDADADCTPDGGSLVAHLVAQNDVMVTVLISADTDIERVSETSSTPITCSDLTAGSEVKVQGVLVSPREIQAGGINRIKSGRPLALKE